MVAASSLEASEVVFVESAAFGAVINQASSWLERVGARALDDRGKLAAELLFNSGVAVAALRALDNAFRRIVGEMSQFDIDWPDERRRAAIDRMLEIAHSDVILPELQEAMGYLRHEVPALHEPERTPATTILETGVDILGLRATMHGSWGSQAGARHKESVDRPRSQVDVGRSNRHIGPTRVMSGAENRDPGPLPLRSR